MVPIHANDDEPTFTSNVPSPLPAGGFRWSTRLPLVDPSRVASERGIAACWGQVADACTS